MSIFKTLFTAGKTALKANPWGLALGAIPSLFGAFNKDQYKSEFHLKTQQLKIDAPRLLADYQNQLVKEQEQIIIQNKKNMEGFNIMEFVNKHLVKIGGALAVIGLAWYFLKGGSKKYK